ncbi:ATP-binding cassette domain-containing protein [Salibacterium aidingense]|uniref:ATP-binding cassette domain-containing protein n=1 Tax=Salibacterium aidingense TaxID=384933 RepID=UPI003BCA6553
MSDYILKTTNLSKRYKHDNALENINVSIKKGDIYGLIGQNGEGKSTMLRLVAGLTFPTSGCIELFGKQHPSALTFAQKRMGAIIENPAIFPDMTAYENLVVKSLMEKMNGTTTGYLHDGKLSIICE